MPQNLLKDTADVRVMGDAVNNKCASWQLFRELLKELGPVADTP